MTLCLQRLALIILKLGMVKVAVSNWSSKKSVMKLLCFESNKIGLRFFAFCEKGPIFNLKKYGITNGLTVEIIVDMACNKFIKIFRAKRVSNCYMQEKKN